MKIKILIWLNAGWLLTCIFLFKSANAQNNLNSSDTLLHRIISVLSSDSLEGRLAGTSGEKKARYFLLNYFEQYTVPLKNNYEHLFDFVYDNTLKQSANLVGIIKGETDSNFIICAHYDHIGKGEIKSRSIYTNKLHPGADDNASGIAALIYLMKYFNKQKLKNSLIFVAFGAHEEGLFGSEKFVCDFENVLKYTCLVINMDMIGRLDTLSNIIRISTNDIKKIKSYISLPEKPNLLIDSSLVHTDAYSFALKQIPCFSITTGKHDDYHKPTDLENKINYTGMKQIIEIIIQLIKNY